MNHKIYAAVAIIGAMLLFPLIGLSRYYLILVIMCCYYLVLASGWNLLIGYTGQISFAQAAFSSVGAYTSAMLVQYLEIPPLLGIVSGTILAGAASFLLGIASLKMIGAYLALGTIGFSESVRIALLVNYEWTGGATGFAAAPLFSREFLVYYYYMFVAAAGICTLIAYVITTSKTGLMMRAVRDDQDAAMSLGVNVRRVKLFVFTVAGMLAGFIGGLFGHYIQVLHPDMGSLSEMGVILAMPIIGGLGTVVGPVAGSILVVIAREYIRASFGRYDVFVFALLVIVVMRFARNGIVGIIGQIRRRTRPLSIDETGLSAQQTNHKE